MSVLAVINRFLTLVMIVFALVVGFIFGNCNEDMSSMSTWLLVYGFMEPLLCILNMIISRCALPSIFLAMEEESERKIISLLPCIIFSGIVGFGSLIFNIAWTISVQFFSSPSHQVPTQLAMMPRMGRFWLSLGPSLWPSKLSFASANHPCQRPLGLHADQMKK